MCKLSERELTEWLQSAQRTSISAQSLWDTRRPYPLLSLTSPTLISILNWKWCKPPIQIKRVAKMLHKCKRFLTIASSLITIRALSMPSRRKKSISLSSQTCALNSIQHWFVWPVRKWPKTWVPQSNYRQPKVSSRSQLVATLRRHRFWFVAKETTPCWDSLMCATTRSVSQICGSVLSWPRWTKSFCFPWARLR